MQKIYGPNGYCINIYHTRMEIIDSITGQIMLMWSPEYGEAIFNKLEPKIVVALREDLDYARSKVSRY